MDPDRRREQVLKSETVQAPARPVHLATSATETIGCAAGTRPIWLVSLRDGMFLTLTAIDDACANRRDALARVGALIERSAPTEGSA